MKGKDKKQENNNPPKQQKQKNKSRRRDLFETAPISRNIFDTQSNDLQQYTNQTVIKKTKEQSRGQAIKQPIINNINKQQEQNKPKQVIINTNFPNSNNDLKQSSDFIFQASSSSEDQIHQRAVNHNVQIIFNDDDDDEEQSNKIKKKNKSIIQLFGQKVQIEMQVNWDQNSENASSKIKKQNNPTLSISPNISQEQKKPKQFLKAYSCMPYNTFAKLKLVRNKSSQGGQTFMLYLESNLRYIMSAKNTTGQTYIMSESYDNYIENGEHYLGKVKSSFFGNQLNLFTRGLHPQKAKIKNQYPRQIICTVVTHSQQIMEDVKPRDFTVYLLKPEFSYYKDLIGLKLYQEEVSLDKLFNEYEANRDKIFYFENRKSKWNQKQKMHSLNMKGRAKLPSVKNFILQNPGENGRQIMLFGKMEQNQFSFDIHYPMSPFIGMAIALTSFTHKSW